VAAQNHSASRSQKRLLVLQNRPPAVKFSESELKMEIPS